MLAGYTPEAACPEVSGSLLWNGLPYDTIHSGMRAGKEAWELCAYVSAVDEHWRDLCVRDIVTYAMSLRCRTAEQIPLIAEYVDRALDLAQLARCSICVL